MIRKFTETDRISVPDLGSDLLPLELKAEKTRFGDHLARNMAAAALLVLTVVSVRNAQLPGGKTVMTAVQEMVDPGTIWVKSALSVSCFRKHWRSFLKLTKRLSRLSPPAWVG